jgi:FkbM family methyltransferase
MDADDLVVAYKKCQTLTEKYYAVSMEQAYIEPEVAAKSGNVASFQYLMGTIQARHWYGGQALGNLDFEAETETGESLRILKEGDVVLDCGAHTGFYTTYFAKAVGPAGFVFAFDPYPQNVDLIEYNAILNGLSNVMAVQKAVGSRTRALFLSQDCQNATQYSEEHLVRTFETTIDSYLRFAPTFLKIDIEGFEVEALRGAQAVLKTRPRFHLEVHGPLLHLFGHTVEDVVALLPPIDDYDYYLKTVVPDGPTSTIRKISELRLDGGMFSTLLGFPK